MRVGDARTGHIFLLVASAARAVEIDGRVDEDFNVQNLGVQLRYRYEVAPLSYLYVVYGLGGY
jgi:hypothetical protein